MPLLGPSRPLVIVAIVVAFKDELGFLPCWPDCGSETIQKTPAAPASAPKQIGSITNGHHLTTAPILAAIQATPPEMPR
jgi:hypothetical protein